MAKKKKNQLAEAQVHIDDQLITVVPDRRSPELDHLLQQRGAGSFVFIPLAKLNKKGRENAAKPKAIAKKKAKLPEIQWYDGTLRNTDDDVVVPGVFAFDMRRQSAREVAATLGVDKFLWGAAGVPVEAHDAKVFEVDDDQSWQSARARALVGLSDMLDAVRHLKSLQTAVEESQTTMQKFWRLVVVVLMVSIFAGAIDATLAALLGSFNPTAWLVPVMGILFYPSVIPALLVGIYLRVLMRRGEAQARDFTAMEAEQNWIKVAPHLLALWALCWVAVLLLTWLQTVPSADLGFLGRTDGVTTSFIICVWMLLPIAHSHDFDSLLNSAFGSAITAAVSIFMIKLSLFVTNLISDALMEIIAGILQIEIPEWLEQIINTVVNIGAEVFFVAVLLGYAWSRTRQQFMRL